jgi:hypothetical protein
LPCSSGISPLPATHPTGHAMTGCGPPPGISLASPWSRVVHNGFGSYKSDLGIFIPCASHVARTRFRCVFRLATQIHSLALASRRMIRHCSTLVRINLSIFSFTSYHNFHALPSFHHLVSDLFNPTRVGSFQLSLALLVHYRSIVNI